MKVRNLKIRIENTKQVLNRFATVMEKLRKGIPVEREEGLAFENMATFRKFMTPKRLELLHTIKTKDPDSVYELAKLVQRDLKSVNTDLAMLESLEIISMERTKDEKNRVKPRNLYDRISVEIDV